MESRGKKILNMVIKLHESKINDMASRPRPMDGTLNVPEVDSKCCLNEYIQESTEVDNEIVFDWADANENLLLKCTDDNHENLSITSTHFQNNLTVNDKVPTSSTMFEHNSTIPELNTENEYMEESTEVVNEIVIDWADENETLLLECTDDNNVSITSTHFENNHTINEEVPTSPTVSEHSSTIPELNKENTKQRKRKGLGDSNNWLRNREKKARRLGESYLGVKKNDTGKYVQNAKKKERKMRPSCKCKRSEKSKKFHCHQFNDNDRQQLFTNFWKNMDWNQRKIYTISLVKQSSPATRRKGLCDELSRKNIAFQYHLKKNNEPLRVCKVMFLATFDIGEFSVRDWVSNSINESPATLCDPPKQPTKKKCADKLRKEYLTNFLSELPKLESHYCRANTSKLFLEAVWESKRHVFQEYKKTVEGERKPSVEWSTFQRVFHSLNLSLFSPKKDQCDLCSSYHVGNLSEIEYNLHQENKSLAREEKSRDTEICSTDKSIRCYTMDVQGVLLSPRLQVSATYYKTKLKVHNCTIYNQETKSVTCYVWNESEGGMSGDIFASILNRFLKKECESSEVKTVIVWSDGCTYQNRNAIMASSLLNLAVNKNVNIIQKFLEKGHSQMEVDSCHSLIERKLKKKVISVPADYVEIMKSARQVPSQFDVEVLNHKDFFNFSENLYFNSIRPGLRVGDPVVTDIKALWYDPSGSLRYKLKHTDEWHYLPRRAKKTQRLPFVPKPLYLSRNEISLEKFKHLQELKCHLLHDYRHFYDNLPHQCKSDGACPHILR